MHCLSIPTVAPPFSTPSPFNKHYSWQPRLIWVSPVSSHSILPHIFSNSAQGAVALQKGLMLRNNLRFASLAPYLALHHLYYTPFLVLFTNGFVRFICCQHEEFGQLLNQACLPPSRQGYRLLRSTCGIF